MTYFDWMMDLRNKLSHLSYSHNLKWSDIEQKLNADNTIANQFLIEGDKKLNDKLSEFEVQLENENKIFNTIAAQLPHSIDNVIQSKIQDVEFSANSNNWNIIFQSLQNEICDKKIQHELYNYSLNLSEETQHKIFAKLDQISNEKFDSIIQQKLFKYKKSVSLKTEKQALEKSATIVSNRNRTRWITRIAAVLMFLFFGDMFYTNLRELKMENSFAILNENSFFNTNTEEKNNTSHVEKVAFHNESNVSNQNSIKSQKTQISLNENIEKIYAENELESFPQNTNYITKSNELAIEISPINQNKIELEKPNIISNLNNKIAATFYYEPNFNDDLLPLFNAHSSKNKLAIGANFNMYYSGIRNPLLKNEFSNGNKVDYRFDANFSYGIQLRYDLNPSIALQTGLQKAQFSQRLYELNNRNDYYTTIKASYLQLPLQIIFKNNIGQNALELSLGANYAKLQNKKTEQNQIEISSSKHIINEVAFAHLGVNYIKSLHNNLKFISGVQLNIGRDINSIFNNRNTTNTAVGANIGVLYYIK